MYAARKADDGRIQPLYQHLSGTARLCGAFASVFDAEELGALIGLCHDIGKYADAFQNRLFRAGPKVDHSTAGGQEIKRLCGMISAYPTMGHHTGLPDGGTAANMDTDATLYGRLKKRGLPDCSAFKSEIHLQCPQEPQLSLLGECGFSVSFFVRMLFSCLVDADFLDTEFFMRNQKTSRGGFDDIPALLCRLNHHLEQFEHPQNPINAQRNHILATCRSKAKTLTVCSPSPSPPAAAKPSPLWPSL